MVLSIHPSIYVSAEGERSRPRGWLQDLGEKDGDSEDGDGDEEEEEKEEE